MKQALKRWAFRLLDVEPEAVIVSFWSGDPALSRRMLREVRELLPERRHYLVTTDPAAEYEGFTVIRVHDGSSLPLEVLHAFRRLRVGLAPVLFDGEPHPLRAAAFALTPNRVLAYNRNLERHHLQLSTPAASLLFWRGVPLDRIYLRPSWLWPWKRDRTVIPNDVYVAEGRACDPRRRRVGILSPYFPYPLTHGGAVRIYHLIREAARDFDVVLFAFAKDPALQEFGPLLEVCAKVVAVAPPRYREPRWSTLRPPEAGEFDSPVMRGLLEREPALELLQVEYTQLASYRGDLLVEHDLTQDLYRQVYDRDRTVGAWWNWRRWRLFENRALRRFPGVIVMSEKDASMARGSRRVRVIPNGVDLERFTPTPEPPARRILFVGSFNHFPNLVAFRFFRDQVWPRVRSRVPNAEWTVVAGRDHRLYWRQFTGVDLEADASVRMHDFVRDVQPLYAEANLVIVPTLVSAGTNLKVLEAMAMGRAIVSTTCGCAGLGLEHGRTIWIADEASAFADGVERLLEDPAERARLAARARLLAEQQFDWRAIGRVQKKVWEEMLARK